MTKKSLKWGMVKGDMSIMDKFKMLKELGYDGVELDSPHDLDHKQILAARDKTGLELPGVVQLGALEIAALLRRPQGAGHLRGVHENRPERLQDVRRHDGAFGAGRRERRN